MAFSDLVSRPGTVRRALTIAAAVLGVALIVAGGALLPAEQRHVGTAQPPLVGRVTAVCAAVAPADGRASTTTVSMAAIRQAPGRVGTLTATPMGGESASATVTDQGKGASLREVTAPVVVTGDGVMATASSGAQTSAASAGPDAGLSAAPCVTPGTALWFSGVGATDVDRTELVLSNADDTQAEVDLRFFGPAGRVVVPGSPGLLVNAHESRVLSLSSLVSSPGALGMAVQASRGRVAVSARRSLGSADQPAGSDWAAPSVAPATDVTIPGIPGGDGLRQLVVTNPGLEPARVGVQVLGIEGSFSPAGAEEIEVQPESTGTLELAAGLVGEAVAVALHSDKPVTAAVVSSSTRVSAAADMAVQPAAPVLVRHGASAVATIGDVASQLVLSNPGASAAPVTLEVISYEGVRLHTDDVLLAPGASATRRLTSAAPSHLVVTVPDGSSVIGGLVLTQPEGPVAGLATLPLVSPDVASRAPTVVADPAAGR